MKVTFGVASLSFEGDLPAAIFHIGLLLDDAASWGVKPQLVVVFHTNAGHATLDDDMYNRDRNIATGNPHKALVTDMVDRGVCVSNCAERPLKPTDGGTPTQSAVSKSTLTQWRV